MTREETKKIIRIITMTYPNFKPGELTELVDSWHFFLEDYTYQEIAIALKTFVSTSGSAFAPSASQLIAMRNKPRELAELTEMEAWALVGKAIQNANYHAEEEFEKLPPVVREAVGDPGNLRRWALTDISETEVIASNFQRTYRCKLKQRSEIANLPREAIEMTRKSAEIGQLVKNTIKLLDKQ